MAVNKKKAVPAFDIRDIFSKENLPLICLVALAVFTIVSIVLSIVVFHINPIIACVMVLLSAGLAACLNRIPIWIHGLVFIAQIVIGIMASQLPFMIFMALIYVFGVAFLYVWANK
jgi:hypothetical protein